MAETPKAGSLDEKLLKLIDEGASIDEMVLALHATDFFLYQRLYALQRLGAVASREKPRAAASNPAPKEVVGEESSAKEVSEHARLFYEQNNFEEALVLGRRAHEMAPSPKTAEFLRDAESALGDMLKEELLQSEALPELKVPTAELKTMDLTAPERYLLSRLDGKRTVRAIVQVAPLQELETLRALHGFLARGWISLRGTDEDEPLF
jgi:hypothetical protein